MKLFSESGQKNIDELQNRMFDEARTRIETEVASRMSAGIPEEDTSADWKPIQLRASDVMPYSGDFRASDWARTVGAGTVGIVQGIAGLMEMTGAVPAGATTGPLDEYVGSIIQNMSPSAQEALQRKWASLDKDSVWRNPKSALLQLTQQAPQLAVSFGAAGAGVKLGRAAAASRIPPAALTGPGVGSLAKQALTKGGQTGAAIAGGITEGTLTAGDAAQTVIGEIMKLDATPEQKQALVDAVHETGDIAQIGIVAAAVGLAPGYVYGRILQKQQLPFGATTKGAAGRVLRATATGIPEMGQEAVQEGYQAYKENMIARGTYDPSRDPMKNVLERTVAGAGLGFGMGAIPGAFVPPDVKAALDAQNPPAAGTGLPSVIPPSAFAQPQGGPPPAGWGGPPPTGRRSTTNVPPLRQRPPQQMEMFGGVIPPSAFAQPEGPTGAGRARGGYVESLLNELEALRSAGPLPPEQRRAARIKEASIVTELQRLGVDPNAAPPPAGMMGPRQQLDLFEDQQPPQPRPEYLDTETGQYGMFPPGQQQARGGEQLALFPDEQRQGPWTTPQGWQYPLPFDRGDRQRQQYDVIRADTPEQAREGILAVTRSGFAPYLVFNPAGWSAKEVVRLRAMMRGVPEVGELLVSRNKAGDVIVSRDERFITAFEEGRLPEETYNAHKELNKDMAAKRKLPPRQPQPESPTEQQNLPFNRSENEARRIESLYAVLDQLERTKNPSPNIQKNILDLRTKLETINDTIAAREKELPVERLPSDETYQKDFGIWDETSKYQHLRRDSNADVNAQYKLAVFQGREQEWNPKHPVPKPGEPVTRDTDTKPESPEESVRNWLPFTQYKNMSPAESRGLYNRAKQKVEKRRSLKRGKTTPEERDIIGRFLNPPQNAVNRVTPEQVYKVLGFDNQWELRLATLRAEAEQLAQGRLNEQKAAGVLARLSRLITEMEQPGVTTVPDLEAVSREVNRIQNTTKNPKRRAARLKKLTEQEVPTRTDTTLAEQQQLPLGVNEAETYARRRAEETKKQKPEGEVTYTTRSGKQVTLADEIAFVWGQLKKLYAGNEITEQEAERMVDTLVGLVNTLSTREMEYRRGASPYALTLQEAKDWLDIYESSDDVSAVDVLREIDNLFQTDTDSVLALAPEAGGLAKLIARMQEENKLGRNRRVEAAKAATMAEVRRLGKELRRRAGVLQRFQKQPKQLSLFAPKRQAKKSLKKTERVVGAAAREQQIRQKQKEAALRQMKAEQEQQRRIAKGMYAAPEASKPTVNVPLRAMLDSKVKGIFETALADAVNLGLKGEERLQHALTLVRKRARLKAKGQALIEQVAKGKLGWSDVVRDLYLQKLAASAVAAQLDVPANRAAALVQEHSEYLANKEGTPSTISRDPRLASVVESILSGQLKKAVTTQESLTIATEEAAQATESKELKNARLAAQEQVEDEEEGDTGEEEDQQDASELEREEGLLDVGREEEIADEVVEEMKKGRKGTTLRRGRGKGRGKKLAAAKPAVKESTEPPVEEKPGAVVPVGTGRTGDRRATGGKSEPRRLAGAINLTAIKDDTPRVVSADTFADLAENERPYEHQLDGANMILHRINSSPKGSTTLLADSAGMGKTMTMLLAALERSKKGPVLIVLNNLDEGLGPFVRDITRFGANIDNLYFLSYRGALRKTAVEQLDPAALAEGKVKTKAAKAPRGEFDTLFADEAHAVKKGGTSTTRAVSNLPARHRVYATATPADKFDSMAAVAEALGLTETQLLDNIGLYISGEYQDGTKSIEPKPGLTIEDVYMRLAEALTKGMDSYAYIRRDYPLRAKEEQRNILETEATQTEEGKALLAMERQIRRAYDSLDNNERNQAGFQSSFIAEALKVEATVRTIKQELAAGRSVVVLGAKYSENQLSSSTANKIGLLGKEVPSGLVRLNEALKSEGIRAVTYWGAGGTNTNEARRQQFQNDEVHVFLGQLQKAGQSIDLDAQKETSRPRTLILMIPPWSFAELQQAMRRVARAGTKSEAKVIHMVAPFMLGDQLRMAKLAVKEDLLSVLEDPRAAIARQGYSARAFGKVVQAAFDKNRVVVRFQTGSDKALFRALQKVLNGYIQRDERTDKNEKKVVFSQTSASYNVNLSAWDAVREQLQTVFDAHVAKYTPAQIETVVNEAPVTPVSNAAPKSLKKKTRAQKQEAAARVEAATQPNVNVQSDLYVSEAVQVGNLIGARLTPTDKTMSPILFVKMDGHWVAGLLNKEGEAEWVDVAQTPEAYHDILVDYIGKADAGIDTFMGANEDLSEEAAAREKAARKAWGSMPAALFNRLSTGKVISAREAVEIIEKGMPKWNILGRRMLRRLRLAVSPETMVVYSPESARSFFRASENTIYIRGFMKNGYIGMAPAYHVLHEVIHSVTEQALVNNAEFRNEGIRLLNLVKKTLEGRAAEGRKQSSEMLDYALTSVSEFLAVGLTDFRVAAILDSIADPMAPKMGAVRRTVLGTIRDMWLKLLNFLYQGYNKSYAGRYRKGRDLRPTDYTSVFESLLVATNRYARPHDASTWSNLSHAESLLETGHGKYTAEQIRRNIDIYKRRELGERLEKEYLNIPLFAPPYVTEYLNAQTVRSLGRTVYGKVLEYGVLPLMNIAQLSSTFGHRFRTSEGDTRGADNLIAAYSDALGLKDRYVSRYQTLAKDLFHEWTTTMDALGADMAEKIHKHWMETSIEQVWPDRPFDDPNGENHSLMYTRRKDDTGQWERRSDEDIADARAIYDRLRNTHEELARLTGGKSSTLFRQITKWNADDWDNTTFQIMRNILLAMDFRFTDENGVVYETQTEAQKTDIARRLLSAEKISDVGRFDSVEEGEINKDVTEALNDSIEDVKDRYWQRKQGPYFGARRHGDTVVEATRNPKTITVGNAEILMPQLIAAVVDKMERKLGLQRPQWGDTENTLYRAELMKEVRAALRRQLRERVHRLRSKDKRLRIGQPQLNIDIANLESGNHSGSVDYSEYSFQLFENDGPALQQADDLRKEGWEVHVGAKRDYFNQDRIEGSPLHHKILSRLPIADATLRNAITSAMIELMAETSIKKAELRRKNRAGYSLDLTRGFAEYVRAAAHYKAQLEHGNTIVQALQRLSDYQRMIQNSGAPDEDSLLVGKIVREIHKHRELDAIPFANNAATRGASNVSFLYMLLSPSYWLINMTQPYLFGLSVLSSRNKTGRAASSYLLQAQKAMAGTMLRRAGKAKLGFGFLAGQKVDQNLFDFLEPSGGFESLATHARLGDEIASGIRNSGLKYKDKVIAMLEELGERNLLTMAMHTDIAEAARGSGMQHGAVAAIMDWSRIMPHLSEVFGRSSVAIAAYQMARDSMPSTVSEEEAHTKAVQAAAEIVRDSMFDYSISNRNRYMSGRQPGIGQLVKLATMFMMHAQHVYVLMLRNTYRIFKGQTPDERKEAFKVVTRILGGHMLVGGVLGAIFEPAKWAMAGLMAIAQGFDDEPDEPWAVVVERTLIDTFGQQLGSALAKGLPYALFGVDLHNRVGLSSLLITNDRLFDYSNTGRQGLANALLSAVGPLGGIAGNMAEASKNIADGDYLRGLEQVSPKMFRDFTRAYRFSTEGMLDTTGNLSSKEEYGIWQAIVTGTGFRTAEEDRAATRKGIIWNLQTTYKNQRGNTMEKYKRLWNAGNTAEARALRAEYNRSVPPEYQITFEDLQRMRKEQAKREAGVERAGVYVPKRERNLLRYVKHLET